MPDPAMPAMCPPTRDAATCRGTTSSERIVVADSEPKTIAERLDAAPTGYDFGQVLLGLFVDLERRMDDDDE